ncbi:GNAT family N-acetyltransferase [Cellulomonas sp. PhB150]|uniref:GNAT family N-acetyltransferase n=1 Tax=Cellulomonas sp. PhB150 TaxID=2485188 RepID=UPI000F4A0DE5|nr:GNAT family N-acetyltransferase [Cellulomonas sp. PhB150]ROS26183.1 RimJ/RimL family protein N-acetyltransferase [Cellulomonas sp. PhB150]
MPSLSPATLAVVRRVWAARLRVDEQALTSPGVVLVERDDMDAVVIVALGDTVVATGPVPALSALAPLGAGRLLDLPDLLQALRDHAPDPIGSASLAYAEPTAGAPAELATDDDVRHVVEACSEADQDESGIREMPTRVVAREDGRPVALAGYEVWDDAVAHLGVLVVPDARGRGLARTAARAAMDHAPGLVPQWRASVDNPASKAVADRLGFVRTGLQIAIDVSRSGPGRG